MLTFGLAFGKYCSICILFILFFIFLISSEITVYGEVSNFNDPASFFLYLFRSSRQSHVDSTSTARHNFRITHLLSLPGSFGNVVS